MGTKRKHKSEDDDKMQADSLKKGDLGSWTSENGNERQTARPTRAGVSDEVAQELQVISNGNANIDGPQVNLQNEISDPDEYANAANATAMREVERTDFWLKTKDEKRSRVANPMPPDPAYELNYVFDRGSTWKQKALRAGVAYGSSSSADSFMPVAGHRAFNVGEEAYHRAEHDDSRRSSQYGRRWRNTQ